MISAAKSVSRGFRFNAFTAIEIRFGDIFVHDALGQCLIVIYILTQSDREQALIDIKEGLVSILIATDVASRGIDIEDITHVVNYDFPRNIEEYVHVCSRPNKRKLFHL